jgi:PKD repeat protein
MKSKFLLNMLLLIVLLTFLTENLFASFEIGNLSHSIEKNYVLGESIKGWVNLSLSDHNISSLLITNYGDEITLENFLRLNNLLKPCEILNCERNYKADNPEVLKELPLTFGESEIIGLKLTGNVTSISSASFTVESNAAESCFNQLSVDILNDESIDFRNVKSSGNLCTIFKTKGCFDDNHSNIQVVDVTSTPYCQRMTLPEASGFRLGANIVVRGSGTSPVKMALYDLNGGSLKGCNIDGISADGEYFCDLDYSSSESKEYYVCLFSQSSGLYQINYYVDLENPEKICGFAGNPPKEDVASYEIIAQSKKFGTIDNHTFSGLGNEIENYILKKYKSLDCSTECVIPINISSKASQKVTLSNLTLNYNTYLLGATLFIQDDQFYDLTEIPLSITADFQKLFLDQANFSIPDKYGDHTFILNLSDKEIFSEKIFIKKIPKFNYLKPSKTAMALQTKFEVDITLADPNTSITKYQWDFGNGDVEVTSVNEVLYAYNLTGVFNITLNITDSSNVSYSKAFTINVEKPVDIINRTLRENLESLERIKSQIQELPQFHQTSLKVVLALGESENKLIKLQRDFETVPLTKPDIYYVEIMKELLEMDFPLSILITKSANNTPFFPLREQINLDLLKKISGSDLEIENEGQYLDSVLFWNQKNLDTKITYKQISADYEYATIILLNVFELDIEKKDDVKGPLFFIMKKFENINFKEEYEEKEEGDYIYIDSKDSKDIVFSTTDDMVLTNLPFFFSPRINELTIPEEITPYVKEERPMKWYLFGLIIFLLVTFGFILYLIMREWYKRKYEGYLFKNKQDLYNLISFIRNSRNKGMTKKDILSKLKKAGWSSEQIKYALKKSSKEIKNREESQVKS